MGEKRRFSVEEARSIGAQLGIDWAKIDPEQFRHGVEVELEHGVRGPKVNATNDDPLLMGKIAWANLKEIRDYYTWLDKLEIEAESLV